VPRTVAELLPRREPVSVSARDARGAASATGVGADAILAASGVVVLQAPIRNSVQMANRRAIEIPQLLFRRR
jgi:hypothetical protein